MTVQQKNQIKRNLPTWLTLANLLLVLTLSYKIGVAQTRIEDNIEVNRKTIEQHSNNQTVHMPFTKKIEVFVPRVEIDRQFESIKHQLDRIEEKLNK